MARKALTKAETEAIDGAVAHFAEHRHLFDGYAQALVRSFREDGELAPYIHFMKYRLKSADRLRQKLTKKALEQARGTAPQITADNLFERINDLAGVRILHLHTNQMEIINGHILRIVAHEKLRVIEGPIANCWDVEYENLFNGFGIETRSRDSMYTSVHYILGANIRTRITFELQVRTLMEEVWGEVSHRVDYEEEDTQQPVGHLLKILARMTSGSTRLVDCIFETHADVGKRGDHCGTVRS